MPKGVYRNLFSSSKPYRVAITRKGKCIYIGSFASSKEAERAAKHAREQYPLNNKIPKKPDYEAYKKLIYARFTKPEAAYIWEEYNNGEIAKIIADQCNHKFHDGERIRTHKAITYAVGRIKDNDGWQDRLMEE